MGKDTVDIAFEPFKEMLILNSSSLIMLLGFDTET